MDKIITWSHGLKRQELHDACWIMGNHPEKARMIEKHPVWSLLPIRYYRFGTWEYLEKIRVYSRSRHDNGAEHVTEVNYSDSLELFAQTLWEKAAEIIIQEYPDIMDIQFSHQTDDGIYPITFKYDIEEIAEAQRRIMRGLIAGGFSVDEYLRLEKVEEERRYITYRYEGVLAYSGELHNAIQKTMCGDPLPVTPRANVQYTYEECEEYYKSFDARMLVLGNQRRAYRYFEPQNHALFEAAIAGNKEAICGLIIEGRSLNEIAPNGDTAFSLLLHQMIHIDGIENRDISDEDERFLDFLFEKGANINLIGVDECADPPLFYAVIRHVDRLIKWLLDHGADPSAEVIYDDSFDNGSKNTIQGWIDECLEEDSV